jgi:hypothetical protein
VVETFRAQDKLPRGDDSASREARLLMMDEVVRSQMPDQGAMSDKPFDVQYDKQGRISKVSENLNGRVNVLEAGKDFNIGDAKLGADGSISIKSPDGKQSYTLNKDLTCTTKILGDKADGSADKLVRVRTKDGVERSIFYDEKTGEPAMIVDRLRTNSGKDLVETTSRLGTSNVWAFESNYGRGGQRTNLVFDKEGNYTANEIKRSIPKDLSDRDNSDGMHGDVASARARLSNLASDCGVFGGSKEKLESWTHKFEQRCRDLAHDGRRAPTDEQICKTYDYLERILKGSGNGIGSTSRRMLVESALREYAEPNKYINQGSHPSCCLAATERHVVETMPDDHARVLFEAITYKSILSKGEDANGKHKKLTLNDTQLKLDNESASAGKGSGWGAAWSYSNKLFQIAAIKLSYPGYQGNGHGFPGAGIDQARTANKFITGEKTIPLVNRWYGSKPSFSSLESALKKGTVHYFVPGHAMSIDKAKVQNGVQYVHIDNWWGGQGDGWRRYDRV